MAGPLVGTVEDLPVDVVLALVGRAVPPPCRGGPAVTLQLAVFPFSRYLAAVEVVHDPRLAALLEGVQHPAEERMGLPAEADPAHRVDGECVVPDPRVAVVPVPHAADRRWQGGRRRCDE